MKVETVDIDKKCSTRQPISEQHSTKNLKYTCTEVDPHLV